MEKDGDTDALVIAGEFDLFSFYLHSIQVMLSVTTAVNLNDQLNWG